MFFTGGGVHLPRINTTPLLGRHPQADTPLGRHPFWADASPGQTPPKQTPPLGRHLSRQTVPAETATAADGMHPTGMHSCLGNVVITESLKCTSAWPSGTESDQSGENDTSSFRCEPYSIRSGNIM